MGKRVLICDDEPYILETLAYLVQDEGYETILAEDGEECLEKAELERPDLIFLDITLPDKDGYEVCRELRSKPSRNRPYIIMLTARGQESDRVKGIGAGTDEYITKPFSPRKISQKLHQILDREGS